VLETEGRVVAYAGVWLVITEGHITNIAVHPDFRGRGYGERITRALMEQSLAVGISWLTLEVRRTNHIAQNRYTKLGFHEVGIRKKYYEDNGEDALIMVVEDLREAMGFRE
jgi:ribosomal-protein-alanine N-acetyltransferase